MKVANEIAHRALGYVAAVRRQGYKLSQAEFAAYLENPFRKVKSGFGISDWTKVLNIFETPAETNLEWFERLNWLTAKPGFVDITDLGRAVLASADEEDVEADMMEVTLDTADPFSYARVIGRIAQRGDALLVDPFFKLDNLLDILVRTTVRGVLMSPQTSKTGKADIAGLGTALSRHSFDRKFEIRLADDIHDRYVIPRTGPVDMLGTSLSGVGKKPTLLVTIKSTTASDELRKTYQAIWDRATPLAAPSTARTAERAEVVVAALAVPRSD